MDAMENEDCKQSVITVQDFPFICRVCCLKRSDLRLFQEEKCLLDLFHAIMKIDVHSTAEFPKNVCNECISELADISLFIDISKHNNESFGKNMQTKKEIVECTTEVESGMSRKIKIFEEIGNGMFAQGSQICRICLSSSSSLMPFGDKTHLIQLFENITNTDAKTESNISKIFSICNKCSNELEKISSFVTSSLHNIQKLEHAIGMNKTVKTENYSNPIDMELSTCPKLKLESVSDWNEIINENSFEEIPFFHESKVKLEIIYFKEENVGIREEITDSGLSTYQELKFESVIDRNEIITENTFEDISFSNESKVKPEITDIKEDIIDIKEEIIDSGFITDNVVDLITQSVKSPFICECCQKSFERMWNFQQHVLTHSEKKPFKCDSCEKGFKQKSHLKQHMRTHSEKKPFKCDSCEKGFSWKSNLQKHMLIHNGKNPFKCDFCQKGFKQKSNLKKHMHTHIEEKPFKYNSYEKCLSWKNNLQEHVLINSGENPFKCESCEKCFSRKYNLQKHMTIHNGENPFKCDCCEKSFKQKPHLQGHMLTHSGEKPFKCDSCEKCFSWKSNLKKHMLIHIGENPFKCDSCGKSFRQRSNLKRHVFTHSGEKPFKCNHCEKGFKEKSHLKGHMLTHSGEKPFRCNICEKRFIQKLHLKGHMLTHIGEKPFKCDICERCYSQESYLQVHMLTHKSQ